MYWVMNLQAFAFAIGMAFAQHVLSGTPYKLFKFSDPLSNCGEGEDTYDHGTRKLWDICGESGCSLEQQ
jgi:hypothetical protein